MGPCGEARIPNNGDSCIQYIATICLGTTTSIDSHVVMRKSANPFETSFHSMVRTKYTCQIDSLSKEGSRLRLFTPVRIDTVVDFREQEDASVTFSNTIRYKKTLLNVGTSSEKVVQG